MASDMTGDMTSDMAPEQRRGPARSDVVGTGILAVVGAVALVMGLGYGFLQDDGIVGPGFLPVVTGGFILVAALAEIARMYLEPAGTKPASLVSVAEDAEEMARAASHQADEERDTFGRTRAERSRAIGMVFALILAALILTPLIGLLLSLTAMVLAIVLWVERKPVLPAVLATGGALLVAYLIFVQVLGVPVPQGALGLI